MTTLWQGHHPDKDQLRADVWAQLQQQGATYRNPVGHIPDFVGSAQAAERLAALSLWQQASVIKCNPDRPQYPVRLRALQDGKRLYMAVPRLTNSRCFVELDADLLQSRHIPLEEAAIARKALSYGRLVSFREMLPIDLVMVGCVAVTRNGGRIGKGAGFADLELAMLQEFDLVKSDTPIVTTVHALQVVEDARLPMQVHDWPLNWIITPEEAIETHSRHLRPAGLDWSTLRPEQLKTIPILQKLRDGMLD